MIAVSTHQFDGVFLPLIISLKQLLGICWFIVCFLIVEENVSDFFGTADSRMAEVEEKCDSCA